MNSNQEVHFLCKKHLAKIINAISRTDLSLYAIRLEHGKSQRQNVGPNLLLRHLGQKDVEVLQQ